MGYSVGTYVYERFSKGNDDLELETKQDSVQLRTKD